MLLVKLSISIIILLLFTVTQKNKTYLNNKKMDSVLIKYIAWKYGN